MKLQTAIRKRYQPIVIGRNTSDLRRVNVGVAQGSKMGGVIYLNDVLSLGFYGNNPARTNIQIPQACSGRQPLVS